MIRASRVPSIAAAVALAAGPSACGVVAGMGQPADAHVADGPVTADASPDAHVPTGTPRWALAFGDSGADSGTALAIDRDGTIVAGGSFQGAIDVGGPGPLTSAGKSDMYLTRRGPDGAFRSAIRYGGNDDDTLADVTVLPSGNLGVVGAFAGTTDLGDHTAIGPSDGLIAVLTASLARVWSGTMSGSYVDNANAIAVGAGGHLVVGGDFAYDVTIGGAKLVGDGLDGYVVSFDASGVETWAKDLGGGTQMSGPNDVVRSIATDDAGNVYVAGYFEASADIAGTHCTSLGSYDIFLVKWNADGVVQWVKTFGGAGDDLDPRIAVDSARNVYLTAHFNATASFGGGPVTPTNGQLTSVIAKYDTSGAYVWQLQTPAILWGIAVAGNELHVAGTFAGTLDLGNGASIVSAGGNDVFVGHVVDGALVWGAGFGGAMDDGATRIAIAPDGADVITGAFAGTATFGAFALSSKGGADAFLVELAP